jgi:hypothetical protein
MDGAQGPTGPSGANGQDGPTGADGIQGPTGPSGSNGADGLTGSTGMEGPVGATGAPGTNGTNGTLATAFAFNGAVGRITAPTKDIYFQNMEQFVSIGYQQNAGLEDFHWVVNMTGYFLFNFSLLVQTMAVPYTLSLMKGSFGSETLIGSCVFTLLGDTSQKIISGTGIFSSAFDLIHLKNTGMNAIDVINGTFSIVKIAEL